MGIEAWNARLKNHFDGLRQKVCSGRSRPVFGLEHGLSLDEASALQTDIRECISRRSPSDDDMLPWVVYATEIGYKYEGHEYWQTFERLTPGWLVRGDRYWLRSCFHKFCEGYVGARPAGIWAEHFSIICWPITHAILPLDLQRHLARILYDLRRRFSREMLDDPKILGDIIAQESWSANSRFQEFAQNSLLVGQIAAALLVHGQDGYDNLILPSTLERIKRDLDNERASRHWLQVSSRYAQKARLSGVSRGGIGSAYRQAATVAEASEQLRELAIEPRIVLQPTDLKRWRVLLEIPSLSQMLAHFPQLRPALADSRCRVTGSSGRWQARGWLLYGSQVVPLDEWPRPDQVLVKFERSTPHLDFLLRGECLLRPGPISLFRIASDGQGYQILSLALRPGNKYVVVSTSGQFSHDAWLVPAILDCTGAEAAVLDMPDRVSPQLEQAVKSIGLRMAKTILVEPAGLTASHWDGEGKAEWISSERPCIAISTDQQVSYISIALDGDQGRALRVSPTSIGEPVFIGLPQLPVGTHRIDISVRFSDVARDELGFLEFTIRESQPWRPGMGVKTALTALVDPRDPTMEQLWEDRLDICLLGPETRTISCRLSLFSVNDGTPILSRALPQMGLPVDVSLWRSYFEENVRRDPGIASAYDHAHSCTLLFEADELGSFTLNCVRGFRPLRWFVQGGSSGYALRLLDDLGLSSKAVVSRYEFEHPDTALPVDETAFVEGNMTASDGLFSAAHGEWRCGVIIPPWAKGGGRLSNLRDLGLKPNMKRHARSTDSVLSILACVGMWSNAQLTGHLLARIRQQQVIDSLLSYLSSLIGGEVWGKTENTYLESAAKLDKQTLARGISDKAQYKSGVDQLRSDGDRIDTMSTTEVISTLSNAVTSHLPLGTHRLAFRLASEIIDWLSEFALRLASSPAGVSRWAGEHLRPGIDLLLLHPILFRCARFIVLVRQSEHPCHERRCFDWEGEHN